MYHARGSPAGDRGEDPTGCRGRGYGVIGPPRGSAPWHMARTHLSSMLDVTSASECGRRAQNEDSLLANEELGIFAVADGIGGERGGAIASSLAVGAIDAFFRRATRPEPEVVR